MTRTIKIFDTTLRDGEQCPGASLNPEEKLEIAKQLAKLNVDVIEAGFAIASPGDLAAIKQIAKEVKGPVICSLARAKKEDIDAAAEIREVTSLTRLERRCYTWSKINLKEAIIYNRTPGKTFISINFLNYVDATLTGKRGEAKVLGAHPKISRWLQDNVVPVLRGTGATLKFLGTGAKTDDMISL